MSDLLDILAVTVNELSEESVVPFARCRAMRHDAQISPSVAAALPLPAYPSRRRSRPAVPRCYAAAPCCLCCGCAALPPPPDTLQGSVPRALQGRYAAPCSMSLRLCSPQPPPAPLPVPGPCATPVRLRLGDGPDEAPQSSVISITPCPPSLLPAHEEVHGGSFRFF